LPIRRLTRATLETGESKLVAEPASLADMLNFSSGCARRKLT